MVLASTIGIQSESQGIGDDTLSRVAARASELAALPAIATSDWCQRAAGILAASASGFHGVVIVLVADVAGGGAIRRVDGVGLHMQLRPAREDGVPSMVRVPQPADVAAAMERMTTLGWDAASTKAVVGPLGLVGKAESWAQQPVLGVLSGLSLGQPTVGSMSLTGGAGRSVAVFFIPESGTPGALDPVSQAVVRALLPSLALRARLAYGEAPGAANVISDREQVVLNHLVLGKSVRQIADELGRSPHTVHDHVKSLHRKMNASSRGELIARALGYVTKATRIRDASRPPRQTTAE